MTAILRIGGERLIFAGKSVRDEKDAEARQTKIYGETAAWRPGKLI
jgi:hypothetical protein